MDRRRSRGALGARVWVALIVTAGICAEPTRAAQPAPSLKALEAQLAERMTYWKSHAAQCIPTSDTVFTPFMSKDMTRDAFENERKDREKENSEGQMADLQGKPLNERNPIRCEDDDTVLFAGVRCLAKDPEGCRIIKESQQADGRWWRSPRHLTIQSKEDPRKVADLGELAVKVARRDIPGGNGGVPTLNEIEAYLKQGTTTFSHDAAYAVMAYTVRTAQGPDAFRQWIGWIDQNERCTTFCGGRGTGVPRYCESDNCYFQPADCSKLLAIGMEVGVTIPFCAIASPLPDTFRQHFENKARWGNFDDRFEKALNAAVPDVPLNRKVRATATQTYKARMSELKNMSSRIDAMVASLEQNNELIRKLNVHNELMKENAGLNTETHSAHNLAFMILILEHLDISSPDVHQLAIDLAKGDQDNPFYEYVAYRKSRGARMLNQILDGCPKPPGGTPTAMAAGEQPYRTQWMWETKVADRKPNKSMLWDCLTVAQLWTVDPVKPTFGKADSLPTEIAKWALKEKQVVDTIAKSFEQLGQVLKGEPPPEDAAILLEKLVRKLPRSPLPPRVPDPRRPKDVIEFIKRPFH